MALLKVKWQDLLRSIQHLPQHSLVRNTLWMLLAQGVRLVLQAAYFVIIARALGPEQYGAFVGATALVSILAPFASLGSGNLLIKNVSRDRRVFHRYWGNALVMIVISGSALIGLVLLIAPLLLPHQIPLLLIFLAACADLLCCRILDVAGQAFQSVLWLSKTAQLNILPSVTRIVAALALMQFFPQADALTWTWLYLASTVTSAAVALILVQSCLGKPQPEVGKIKPELREGCYFAVSLSSQTIYNDIDKTMLARLATLEATGIYAAAYRLIDVAFVPVRSLLAAAYTRFFQRGARGISGSLPLTRQLTPIAAAYGLGAGISLFFLAPVIPNLLGQEYSGTVEALRWLAPLPLLKALHYFAADTLTGSGFQGFRTTAQVGVAILNLLLNLWLIPIYSWRGAAGVSLISDGLLMLSLWTIVLVLARRQSSQTQNFQSLKQPQAQEHFKQELG